MNYLLVNLNLNGLADVNKLHEIGIQWSDAVSHGSPDIDEKSIGFN